jgi:hypothetical protein
MVAFHYIYRLIWSNCRISLLQDQLASSCHVAWKKKKRTAKEIPLTAESALADRS